jgi:hypothetical protein
MSDKATMNETMDVAQAMVTAILHGDRHTAVELAASAENDLLLALVLADLAAYVHVSWAQVLGCDADARNRGWTAIMADVVIMREARTTP